MTFVQDSRSFTPVLQRPHIGIQGYTTFTRAGLGPPTSGAATKHPLATAHDLLILSDFRYFNLNQ